MSDPDDLFTALADITDTIFLVDVGAFEGPLDLLLDLARREKIDLAHVSISQLAGQYLAYIERVREQRLEIAADYLVMAAWLAYLKSRLLLPDAPAEDDEPSALDMADALALRLRQLDAIRAAGADLMERPRLGYDIFARGGGEGVRSIETPSYDVSLYELLSAYAHQRGKEALAHVTVRRRPVLALADARDMLVRLVGPVAQWTRLDALLRPYVDLSEEGRSVAASGFGALLEMVREGKADIRQERPFAPLYVRAHAGEEGHG